MFVVSWSQGSFYKSIMEEATQDQRQKGVSTADAPCHCTKWKLLTKGPQEKCTCNRRRELRARQREALQEIQGETIALQLDANENQSSFSINTTALEAARDRNNELFRRVRHTRELKIDAEILNARTEMCSDQVANMHKVRFVMCFHGRPQVSFVSSLEL